MDLFLHEEVSSLTGPIPPLLPWSPATELSEGTIDTDHPYQSMQPGVIDEDMLDLAIEEQGPQEEAGQLAKQEGTSYKDVLSLQLDIRNILHIDSLWQFENLRTLKLNNNIIERIEGLESLTQLVWLDLSFNNIEVIEGLDTLVNLEDLVLCNNRISRIDSLDNLIKLQVLSLGNNLICNMMNVIYLRRFKALRMLTLDGNPFSRKQDYNTFILAYLPDLVYLDYRYINYETKVLAEIKHRQSLQELKKRETALQARLEEEQTRQEELEEHKAAFVERLNGSFLFDDMFLEDVEGSRLEFLPGISELLKEYKHKFVTICINIFEYGMKQQEKRQTELDTFNECVREAIQANQEWCKLKIAEFEEKHLLCLSAIQDESDPTDIEMKKEEYSEDVAELFSVLMALEIQLVDRLEETINLFERTVVDSVAVFIETVQGLVAQCRELENHHYEKVMEISMNALERIIKGELDDDLPDDIRTLFVERSMIVNSVAASHDLHILKIACREDELLSGINSWCTEIVEKIHNDETMRNRKRVKEIRQYMDCLLGELNNHQYQDVAD